MLTRRSISRTSGQESLTPSSWFETSPPAKKRRITVKLMVTSAEGGVVQTFQKQQPGDEVSLTSPEAASINSSNGSSVAATADSFPGGWGIDKLHDDLLITILTKVSTKASSPADLINTILTCRRFFVAAQHPFVLLNAAPAVLTIKAAKWSDGVHRFLKQCADAGNVEACYTIGMIYFYCLQRRGGGASYMAKAAMKSHAAALLSLAVIQFNGSGGTREVADLRSGFTLCARSARLGNVNAVYELGHCLQDGYGVTRNVQEGRRLILQVNAREAAAAISASPQAFIQVVLQITARCNVASCQHHKNQTVTERQKSDLIHRALLELMVLGSSCKPQQDQGFDNQSVYKLLESAGCLPLSDFGCMTFPPGEIHVANKFLIHWFQLYPPSSGLRLCSHSNCGRVETWKHEFRRCSACRSANYCSRACQGLDWKLCHKLECSQVEDWDNGEDHGDEEGDVEGMDEMEEF